MSRQSPNEEMVVLKVCNEDYFFAPPCTTSSTGAFKRAPQDQLTLVVSCFIWLLCKCWTGAKEFSLGRGSAEPGAAFWLWSCIWTLTSGRKGKSLPCNGGSSFCPHDCWDVLGKLGGQLCPVAYPLVRTWEGQAATGALSLVLCSLLQAYN